MEISGEALKKNEASEYQLQGVLTLFLACYGVIIPTSGCPWPLATLVHVLETFNFFIFIFMYFLF